MQRENRIFALGLAVSALALLAFAWLSEAVYRGHTMAFDLSVRDAIHSFAAPRITVGMRGMTQLGSPWFVITLGAIAILRFAMTGRMRAAVLLAMAAIGGAAFDEVLKLGFHRTRPEAFFGLREPQSYSFPSGHSLDSACFYGVLAAIIAAEFGGWRRLAIWISAGLLVLAIGLSRVYLGVHYPTDVIGGYLGALVWVALVRGGYRFWKRRMTQIPRDKVTA